MFQKEQKYMDCEYSKGLTLSVIKTITTNLLGSLNFTCWYNPHEKSYGLVYISVLNNKCSVGSGWLTGGNYWCWSYQLIFCISLPSSPKRTLPSAWHWGKMFTAPTISHVSARKRVISPKSCKTWSFIKPLSNFYSSSCASVKQTYCKNRARFWQQNVGPAVHIYLFKNNGRCAHASHTPLWKLHPLFFCHHFNSNCRQWLWKYW